ncbi:M15 family metallopeptidase [Rhizosphaericola mali]|uniref:D-alanyl-D-alanine dipeptidase n=1 Tax=Rhizosphaericola mali TaxID=2545455 RepID=A0A5P2G140_9BACT|nr:M15 family metallopeptidase [Rhizosphaericola mali]QES89526.1 M15 family metallopeptidase [Rhizosphaericola mali]
MKNKCLNPFISISIILTLSIIYGKSGAQLTSIKSVSQYEKSVPKNKRLVLLSQYIPNLKENISYSTTHNFTKQVLYHDFQPFATIEMAEALQKANQALNESGFGILLFDAYRPYHITQLMWKIVPDDRYAANPAHGSDHNRGTAVDISLYDLKTGKELAMPTEFDNFTEKAHRSYMQLSATQIKNRKILEDAMIAVGLKPLSTEWWHFSLSNSKIYPLLDLDYTELK